MRRRIAGGLALLFIGLVAMSCSDTFISEADAQGKKPPSKAQVNQIIRHKQQQMRRDQQHAMRHASRPPNRKIANT